MLFVSPPVSGLAIAATAWLSFRSSSRAGRLTASIFFGLLTAVGAWFLVVLIWVGSCSQ